MSLQHCKNKACDVLFGFIQVSLVYLKYIVYRSLNSNIIMNFLELFFLIASIKKLKLI